TSLLLPDNYETKTFFEPRMKENPARRPPKIYNVEEAIAEVTNIGIDTYLFDNDFQKIWILVDKDGKRSAWGGGGNAGANPFAQMMKGGGAGGSSGGMGQMMQQRGMQGGNPQMQQMMRQNMQRMGGGLNAPRQFAPDDGGYNAVQIPI